VSGAIADLFGLMAAVWVVAAVTALGAGLVAIRMYETRPHTIEAA